MNKLPYEKPKRKSLSKKLRFEVFKRDSFTCQYCGRKAPDVILEVDHITPVAEGGKNDILNLTTVCRDCNRGKGKILLTVNQTIEKQQKQNELLQAKREQLEMMMRWQTELMEQDEKEVDFIENIIYEPNKRLTEYGRRRIKQSIKTFGFHLMIESAKIAAVQYGDEVERFRKIGGIAYNLKNGIDYKQKFRNKE